MRTIEEIRAELVQYKEYEDVPKELRKEYNEISLQIIQQKEAEIYKREQITKGIALDRLEEICNAERDGRLVVLPCGIGDTVYIRKYSLAQKSNVILDGVCCSVKIFRTGNPQIEVVKNNTSLKLELGRQVWVTRESAEKALKGGAE